MLHRHLLLLLELPPFQTLKGKISTVKDSFGQFFIIFLRIHLAILARLTTNENYITAELCSFLPHVVDDACACLSPAIDLGYDTIVSVTASEIVLRSKIAYPNYAASIVLPIAPFLELVEMATFLDFCECFSILYCLIRYLMFLFCNREQRANNIRPCAARGREWRGWLCEGFSSTCLCAHSANDSG